MALQTLPRTPSRAVLGQFPVIRSILSPDALLQEIALRYSIAPVTCRLLKRGLNDTYLLVTNKNRYIVRAYRAGWRSQSAIQCELELLLHLARREVSVAVPIRAEDGTLFWSVSAPEGLRHLVLFSYANGSRVPWQSGDDAHKIGRVAGAIHCASDDFVSAYSRPAIDVEYLFEAPVVSIKPYLAHRPHDQEFLESFARSLRDRIAGTDALDFGVCHGDYGPKNIHADDHGRLTVFDFDLCGPGWRAYDLALIQWVANDHDKRGMWESFLDGYSSVRTLSSTDLQAIPLFHAAAHLASLGLFAQNIGDWGSADMSDWLFDRELAFFRRWAGEHP
jgi:Ser/Thr protein kinase RdoA (MazF antagonist)